MDEYVGQRKRDGRRARPVTPERGKTRERVKIVER